MATGGGGGAAEAGKESEPIKSSFITREGTYKLMTLSEYSRPNRVPLNPGGPSGATMASAPVRVSFLSIPTSANLVIGSSSEVLPRRAGGGGTSTQAWAGDPEPATETTEASELEDGEERICFNVGRELYVYQYRGVRNAADLSKPIDKRVYKGTYPTCHDFNQETASAQSCALLIGFSAGQIQLIDPFRKAPALPEPPTAAAAAASRLFNEDRAVDKTRLTVLRWIPGTPKLFLAAHASGHLYVYNEELACGPGPPVWERFTGGKGFTVSAIKTKASRNPTFRWAIGEGPLNDFQFSPDSRYLATASQDGFLRVFDYHRMELVAEMRSYFGGLLTLAWSPDGKYLVTGGEDDLVTVFSLHERRVVCRGQGHRSWISQVAFDPYTSTSDPLPVELGSEEDLRPPPSFVPASRPLLRRAQKASVSSASLGSVCYRFGSVGHDTQLCLWDLSEDVLKAPSQRQRVSVILPANASPLQPFGQDGAMGARGTGDGGTGGPRESGKEGSGKKHRRGFSFGARLGSKEAKEKRKERAEAEAREENGGREESALRLLGTPVCPRLDEVPLVEPLVCKKIAAERLTVLAFREDCIVTACQEGFICTWARPGRAALSHQHSINSPNPGGSPNLLPGGTVV